MMKPCLYILWAAMLALASCTGDTLQEPEPVHPGQPGTSGTPEGTFIVDYTVDNGSATRAAGKLQVSSLDYYVYYKEGGELAKHRRIPIPDNQVWPLTRDNMTWEQRQALQDTLTCGIDYRILFIANVDSALFNYGVYTAENPHPAVVKGDMLYQNARILLPNVPFHDNNMYCLWEGELNCAESKGVVNRNDILLQRIVTRTDVRRTETPTALYDAIAEGFYQANCSTKVENAVETWVNDFCVRLQDCANNHPFQDIDDYKNDEIPKLIGVLQANISTICTAWKKILIDDYQKIIEASTLYEDRNRQWYLANGSVTVNYATDEGKKRANAIRFDRTPFYDSEHQNVAPCSISNDEVFTIIGFSGVDELNTVSSIDFWDTEKIIPAFTIKGKEFNTHQTINTWWMVKCDPIKTINYISTSTIQSNKEIDLTEMLKDVQGWKDLMVGDDNQSFVKAVNYFWDCNNWWLHSGNSFHNKSFENFPVEVTLPNITSANVNESIELIPGWSAPVQVTGE